MVERSRLYSQLKGADTMSNDTMSERLTKLREKNKMTQTDVARALGVSSALISAYEKNERNPSIDRLVALADIYHTSTDYILGRTTQKNEALLLDISDLSEKQIRILRELVDDMRMQHFGKIISS